MKPLFGAVLFLTVLEKGRQERFRLESASLFENREEKIIFEKLTPDISKDRNGKYIFCLKF